MLEHIIHEKISQPSPAPLLELSNGLREHHQNIQSILAYGSCLRTGNLNDGLIDLYLLTHDLSAISQNFLSQFLCAHIPPNIYYYEQMTAVGLLRCKYAILPTSIFARWLSANCDNPYFWARFAQPCRLLYAENSREISALLTQATKTFIINARTLDQKTHPAIIDLDTWKRGFSATYETELRPEGPARADTLVEADADYYQALTPFLYDIPDITVNWRYRRVKGKFWSILRLIKAAFTFEGGADYIAWKIARHSNVNITIKPWHRRHPLIASLWFLPHLLKSGAIK